jgi:acyl dehydratase
MTHPLFFEDLAEGQRFTSAPAPMDRDRLLAFAAEFDPQPQHISDQAAATSQFGQLVASGWHTAAITMRLTVDAFFGRFPGGGLGAQVDTLAWRRPVLPGDTLYAVIEITALRPSRSRPERGVASIHTTTYNQHDQAVMEQSAAVMLPRRPVTTT